MKRFAWWAWPLGEMGQRIKITFVITCMDGFEFLFLLIFLFGELFFFYSFFFLEREDQEGNRELVELWGKISRVTNMQIKRRRRMLKPTRR